jgi:hypothetical protein
MLTKVITDSPERIIRVIDDPNRPGWIEIQKIMLREGSDPSMVSIRLVMSELDVIVSWCDGLARERLSRGEGP